MGDAGGHKERERREEGRGEGGGGMVVPSSRPSRCLSFSTSSWLIKTSLKSELTWTCNFKLNRRFRGFGWGSKRSFEMGSLGIQRGCERVLKCRGREGRRRRRRR